MSQIIKIQDLNYAYDKEFVLKDISCNLEKGKIYSIVGPNGSGKTTLLSLIAKHIDKQKGKIYLYDENLMHIRNKELAREMAVVTQNNEIHYNFTVYDIVMMGRNPYLSRFSEPSKIDKEKVKRALKITDTIRFKDQIITKLSGGEFKRVILARAISQDTKILLLDEPVTALDIKHQINFMDLIKRLCIEKDLTVINVVHDLNLALFYSDEVIMLKKGRVFSKGLINEVLTADNIKSVYGVESTIIPHPIHNDKKVIVF